MLFCFICVVELLKCGFDIYILKLVNLVRLVWFVDIFKVIVVKMDGKVCGC